MTGIKLNTEMTVDLIDQMGTDKSIVIAARVSTLGEGIASQEETVINEGDGKLIDFLMRERHSSPFEHCVMTFRVHSPLFVGRQLLRHRTNSFNEESGRYREMDLEFYVPPQERPLVQVGKPGAYTFDQGASELHQAVLLELLGAYRAGAIAYQNMLDLGVAREVARAALPSGLFSSMYMTMKLRNIFQFLSLRTRSEDALTPSHPQWEIEMVGRQIEGYVREEYPLAYRAWVKHGRIGI